MISSVITCRAARAMSVVALVLAITLGCVPAITRQIHVTVLGDPDQVSVSTALINVAPGVDIKVSGGCLPYGGTCRMGIRWTYPMSKKNAKLFKELQHRYIMHGKPSSPGFREAVKTMQALHKDSPVKFAEGNFVIRDVKNHKLEYGVESPLDARLSEWQYENGMLGTRGSTGFWLGDEPPKEFELVMPNLIVDGVEKKLPVVYFRYSRGPGLAPIFVNY